MRPDSQAPIGWFRRLMRALGILGSDWPTFTGSLRDIRLQLCAMLERFAQEARGDCWIDVNVIEGPETWLQIAHEDDGQWILNVHFRSGSTPELALGNAGLVLPAWCTIRKHAPNKFVECVADPPSLDDLVNAIGVCLTAFAIVPADTRLSVEVSGL